MQIIIIICFLKNVNLQGNIVKCVQIEGQKLDISSQFHYSDVSYHTADLLCLITGAILFINCENDFRLWILCNIALFIFLLIWLLFLHCFRQGNNVIYIYRTHFIHWCFSERGFILIVLKKGKIIIIKRKKIYIN